MIERRLVRTHLGILVSCFGVACSSGVEPHFRPCTAADTQVTLNVNEYVSIDPAAVAGCMVFPATVDSAEYLLVPQITSGVPGQVTSFRLAGDTILPAPAPAPAVSPPSAAMGAAAAFHTFLRLGDERRSWGFAPEPGAGGVTQPRRSSAASPPAMGALRTFQVCAKTNCSTFDRVGARVRAVSNTVVIFVDTLAPAGGLDSTVLDSLANEFDNRLYMIDTAAFGRESDIDSNSVVMVLMTNTVNKLVTAAECSSGFVAGFFFGADLDPAFRNDSRSNKGEVFYSMVADPAGSLSCAHPASDVEKFVPVTFIHEFQHMISFNQHVLLRGGAGEVLWLNEGMSHYAEELGGRSYAASPTGQITDCQLSSNECRVFYGGDLLDAYDYMNAISTHFLLPTAGIGSLPERGAAWMFVRYVVDHYAAGNTMADWNALTRQIDGTTQTGAQNIATVTGDPFSTVVTRWALALAVTDRPGVPSVLQFSSWNYRAVYSSLHSQAPNVFGNSYPLADIAFAGHAMSLAGSLRAGSGLYFRAAQRPGDPGFTISFTAPNGAVISPVYGPRLSVMRLQ